MNCGKIIEENYTEKIMEDPEDEYTGELINKLSEVDDSLKDFVTDEMNLLYLGRLSDAYISTRYMPVEFDEVDCQYLNINIK